MFFNWELCQQILSLTFTLFGGILIILIQNAAVRFTPPRFHTWFVTPVPPPPLPPSPPLSPQHTRPTPLPPEQLQHISGMVQEGIEPLVIEFRGLRAEIQANQQAGLRLETQLVNDIQATQLAGSRLEAQLVNDIQATQRRGSMLTRRLVDEIQTTQRAGSMIATKLVDEIQATQREGSMIATQLVNDLRNLVAEIQATGRQDRRLRRDSHRAPPTPFPARSGSLPSLPRAAHLPQARASW